MPNDRFKCAPFFGMHICRTTIGKHSHQTMFLQVFFSTGTIGRFEGVTTSFAMTESSITSTKTKGATKIIEYLRSEGVDAFYLTN